jgi:hypothetical protein
VHAAFAGEYCLREAVSSRSAPCARLAAINRAT